MMFRKYIRLLNILCIALYLPVLLGGGECVALCFTSEGSFSLDYSHRCGLAEHPAVPENYVRMKGVFSGVSFSEPMHKHSCLDIPLAIGNSSHTPPEVTPTLHSEYENWEYPAAISTEIFISNNSQNTSIVCTPLKFFPACGTRISPVLII
jgi:hypothetical protein